MTAKRRNRGGTASEEESIRAYEGAIQSDLFSEESLEWLMLIDILVIWSCFAQRTFFLENLLSDLMLPATVYLVIFLGEWD